MAGMHAVALRPLCQKILHCGNDVDLLCHPWQHGRMGPSKREITKETLIKIKPLYPTWCRATKRSAHLPARSFNHSSQPLSATAQNHFQPQPQTIFRSCDHSFQSLHHHLQTDAPTHQQVAPQVHVAHVVQLACCLHCL